MSWKKYMFHLAVCALAASAAIASFGQVEHPQTWAQDIALMEQMSAQDVLAHQATVLQIRADVENWLALHPDSGLKLSAAPPQTMTADQASAQLADLKKIVQAIIATDPSHPFHLGVTEVEVSATLSALSPTEESVTQQEIQRHDAVNDTKAIDLMPGVEITETVGKRNESVFNIRGFTGQGRVPLYQDGIPIYVPYDGDLDLNRFLSSDVAEIQIAEGFSSPLLGPGALGGSVNIVTKEPTRNFEGDSAMGTYSGNGLLSSLRLGTHQDRFWAQGALDWLQDDFVPLSGNFAYPSAGYTYLQPGKYNCYPSGSTNCNVPYALNGNENNSQSRDEKEARPDRLDAQGPRRIRLQLYQPEGQKERSALHGTGCEIRVQQRRQRLFLAVALLEQDELLLPVGHRRWRAELDQVPRLLRSVPELDRHVRQ